MPSYSWVENPSTYGHGNPIRQGVICSGLQQYLVYLRFVTTRQNNFLVVGWGHFFFYVTTRQSNFLVVGWGQFSFIWNLSRRDKIIISWWGGGNFFYMSPRDKIIISWWGGGNFFYMSRRDKIIFSWWVEPTKLSLFNIIWVSLHHPPRENYFVSSWHRGGSFHLNPIKAGGAEMAVTLEP